MEVELYYDAGQEDEDASAARRAATRLREAGIAYRVIDGGDLSAAERQNAYRRGAVQPAVVNRYGVKRLFGTHTRAGAFFGKDVPALVVLEDGEPRDVYPHEEGGRVVTIEDYVDRITRRERGEALVARMEAVRARIGALGVSGRDLIEEGRRR